jgi:hypothetical protein
LTEALQLTASADLIEPGASVTLQVVQADLTSSPQVITNLVHELPDIKIRGAIPLGALVQAIIGPIAGALSSALPSASAPLSGAVGEVADLLAEPLPIPLAIDIGGRRITRTLAPLTTDVVTTVTSAPGDAQKLTGTVPIDGFLAKFGLSTDPDTGATVKPTWTVVEEDTGLPISYANLSPNLNLVQTLLLLPKVVALGSLPYPLFPVSVDVTVRLYLDFPQLNLAGVAVDLGPVTLFRLPIVLPQIVAVFRNAFEYWDSDKPQIALLSTDSVGVKLMPSLDSVIRLLSMLSSVLDTFAKAAFEVGIDISTDTEWDNLLDLGQGVRRLVNLLGRLPQNKISFQPAYEISPGVDSTFLVGDWDDSVSAVIHIGVPAVYTETKTASGRFLRLYRTDEPPQGGDHIDFNSPDAPTFSFISIIGNLNDLFQNLQQVPPSTAVSNNDTENFNDALDALEFRDA